MSLETAATTAAAEPATATDEDDEEVSHIAPTELATTAAPAVSGADLNTEAGRARATKILNCPGAIRNQKLAWEMVQTAGLPADLAIIALNNAPLPNGGRDPRLGLLIAPTRHRGRP